MTKITFKPIPGFANCHSVFKDGKLVGEFKFIRDRVITTPNGPGGSQRVCTIATAGNLTDFESDGEYDLGCFSYFKDVKRHIEAHYTSRAARLRPTAYRHGQVLFREGDLVRLKKSVAGGDKRPAMIARLYSDIDGGVRLEEERNEFVSWNVSDLEKVEATEQAA
jgi:hypothetical protein